MKVDGKLLYLKYPVEFGPDYVVIKHKLYDLVIWTMKLDELKELAELTEVLLQELDKEEA